MRRIRCLSCVQFASGDSGYVPQQKYPASSPHVTAVGGVTWGAIFKADHIGVDAITTGGFSSLASNAAPTYQASAVSHYLHATKGARPSTGLNASRRCVPDLSAYSTGFYTVQDGSDTVIGGTSAATPVVAGMLSSINDALISAGHSPLGFANPFLYRNHDAFLDVTHGDNGGFAAVEGYDPASGIGTFSPTTFATLRARALAGREALAAKRRAHTGANCEHSSTGRLLVGLRPEASAQAQLERTFWEAAEPASPSFRRYRSVAELRAITVADAAVVEKARGWLRDLTGEANLGVELTPTGDAFMLPWCAGSDTLPPRVPAALQDTVDYAVLLRPHRDDDNGRTEQRPSHVSKPTPDGAFGPSEQKKAYGVPASLKGTNASNWQMVWGSGTFGYRESDLSLFFNTYAPTSKTSDVKFDIHNVWKGKTGDNFVEGTLDASYSAAMAPGVLTVVANTNTSAATEDGEAFGAALLAFLVDLNGRDDVPNVLSMSLGSLSFGSCDKMCTALAAHGGHTYKQCWAFLQSQRQVCMFASAQQEKSIDTEFMKLGLRGVTVLAASGDGGSHFAFGPLSGSIGNALDELICKDFNMPVYPTSSPYALSVLA